MDVSLPKKAEGCQLKLAVKIDEKIHEKFIFSKAATFTAPFFRF